MAEELFAAFTDNTPLAAAKSVFRLPAAVIREAWAHWPRSCGGEQIAFRAVAMPELIRLPALVLGLEMSRQARFWRKLFRRRRSCGVDLAQQSYAAYSNGQVKTGQVLQAVMTLKGNTNFLGWQGLKPTLAPELRAPMAYIFGCRYLRLGREVDARQFFETARDDASADSTLNRLARGRLESLATP